MIAGLERATCAQVYNALCNESLVLDVRSRPTAFPLAGAVCADGEWLEETPDYLGAAVLFGVSPDASAETSAIVARVVARWPSLAAVLRTFPVSDAALFAADFPWMVSPTVPRAPSGGPLCFPSCIAPRLFLGSALHAGTADALSLIGIGAIINCMSDVGGATAEMQRALGLKMARFRWVDDPAFSILSELPRAAAAIEAGRACGRGGVLVHCWRGASRSAAAVAAWLLWHGGELSPSAAAAIAHLRECRSAVDINEGFARELSHFATAVAACGGRAATQARLEAHIASALADGSFR